MARGITIVLVASFFVFGLCIEHSVAVKHDKLAEVSSKHVDEALISVSEGSEASRSSECSRIRGTCEDVNRYTCSTGFKTGKCPGAWNIQCCTDKVSKKSNVAPIKDKDAKCHALSGKCYDTTKYGTLFRFAITDFVHFTALSQLPTDNIVEPLISHNPSKIINKKIGCNKNTQTIFIKKYSSARKQITKQDNNETNDYMRNAMRTDIYSS